MTEVVDLDEKRSKQDLLNDWVAQLIFPGKVKDFVQEKKGYNSPEGEYFREFCIYTQEHKYAIVAIDRPKDDGYLGCQVSCRKARAGEDWVRGNDLPDGPFTKNTWETIIYAIVNYELVKLSDYQKPDEIPDINA
jgi:hypothetical protein